MNKYEVMLIVKPDLGEEEKKNLFKSIDDVLIKNKCQITQSGVWAERRKLCFPIKKSQEGVYYLVSFSGPSEAIKDARQTYKINELILRVLFTRMG
ncbi:MAG: 30S ribosomal protein S6 [Candidatus Omnitrophica bacterium]|jgi:small subunit ribosomal protein S6|nr:30S ribosomal protein S6 [Candidatus Omnitrophota bacterium]